MRSLRTDRTPKSSQAGAQKLEQFLGEDMKGDGEQARGSERIGSFISQMFLGAYCVVSSGGRVTRFKMGVKSQKVR